MMNSICKGMEGRSLNHIPGMDGYSGLRVFYLELDWQGCMMHITHLPQFACL